jgi:hypothetical protein
MDPFHERIARVALGAADRYGFCLAGGYAVQAHGMIERRSEDVDLFTTAAAEQDFPAAVDAVASALHGDGLTVEVTAQHPTFARIVVVDPATGDDARVERLVGWAAELAR